MPCDLMLCLTDTPDATNHLNTKELLLVKDLSQSIIHEKSKGWVNKYHNHDNSKQRP